MHPVRYGLSLILVFGAVVGLASREDASECSAGIWIGGVEGDAMGMECSWNASPEFTSFTCSAVIWPCWNGGPEFIFFACSAVIWPCCVVLPLPHLPMHSIRTPAIFPPCLV